MLHERRNNLEKEAKKFSKAAEKLNIADFKNIKNLETCNIQSFTSSQKMISKSFTWAEKMSILILKTE